MPKFQVTMVSSVEADTFQQAREDALGGVLETTEVKLEFEPVEASHEDVVVRFLYCEEGYNGDYDSEDPTDEPQLRCDVDRAGNTGQQGEQHESCCTQINALTVDRAKLRALAFALAREFHALGQQSWRQRAEALTRLGTGEVNA
jgi:hypothetical protein